MFQEALQFKNVIIIYYNRLNIVRINGRFHLLIWQISKIIISYCDYLCSNQYHS
jgi:hypothetical protein